MATTDQNGYYQSSFAYIPGDEMVTVRASAKGIRSALSSSTGDIHGYEVRQLDFVADQASLTPVAETFVASGRPNQSFGLDSGLWVGYGRPGGDLSERSLLGFSPTLPAGSKITSA